MARFVKHATYEPLDRPVETLLVNFVDPQTDPGALARHISHVFMDMPSAQVATFDADELVDYRGNGPWVNVREGKLNDIQHEEMSLDVLRDMEGEPFLVLRGPEPSFHWRGLAGELREILRDLGVKDIYSFSALPAPFPHTRPVDMFVRSSREDLAFEHFPGDIWFESRFADYLEYQAQEDGISYTNIAVRVPLYLASNRFPAGAGGALSMVARASGLRLPLGDLEQSAANQNDELATFAEQNEEFHGLLSNLEKEYDSGASTMPGLTQAPVMDMAVPSMDEIGVAAERFLSQLDVYDDTSHHNELEAPADSPTESEAGGENSVVDYNKATLNTGEKPAIGAQSSNERAPRKRGKHAWNPDEDPRSH